METPASVMEETIKRFEAYSTTTVELTKLKAIDATTTVVTSVVSKATVVLMFSMFAFVLNIGIALWVGELLGKSYYGFFVVAGFYLIAGIIFNFFLPKWVGKPLSDLIITQALQ